jgi:DNA polymerase delta subunit 1
LFDLPHLSYFGTFPRIFERGETTFRGLFSGPVLTYESNIPFILRFMIDTNVRVNERFCCPGLTLSQVVGMNWIEVPAGKYSLLKGKDKKSHCQIELSVRCGIY